MNERRVFIFHPKDGRRYSVTPKVFTSVKTVVDKDGSEITYEEAGFKIETWEDGEPYEAPRAVAAIRTADRKDDDKK